jgi:hypothetical protein
MGRDAVSELVENVAVDEQVLQLIVFNPIQPTTPLSNQLTRGAHLVPISSHLPL